MKKILPMTLAVAAVLAFVSPVYAKSSSGGVGHSSSGRSSSGRSSSSSLRSKPSSSSKPTSSGKSSASTSKPAPAKPATGKSTARPGSTVKTPSGASVKSSTKKPTNSKYKRSTGIVGDNGYSPAFRGGYTAPQGSVVYYPQHSALDYLPWIYLFSQSNSPRNDSATIVQPDGKQVVTQPVKEGTDGLAWLNWVIMFLIGIGVIAGITYGVYRWTSRSQTLK